MKTTRDPLKTNPDDLEERLGDLEDIINEACSNTDYYLDPSVRYDHDPVSDAMTAHELADALEAAEQRADHASAEARRIAEAGAREQAMLSAKACEAEQRAEKAEGEIGELTAERDRCQTGVDVARGETERLRAEVKRLREIERRLSLGPCKACGSDAGHIGDCYIMRILEGGK